MIDIEMFQIKLIQRVQQEYGLSVSEIIEKIKEDLLSCMDSQIKCDWITCKYNSERDNEQDNQEGECQFLGRIHLNVPEEDIENECLLACRQFQAGEKHPDVKMWFTFPER